jgi:hypothetical protein
LRAADEATPARFVKPAAVRAQQGLTRLNGWSEARDMLAWSPKESSMMQAKRYAPEPALPEYELCSDEDEARTRIVGHPDGYYWIDEEGHQQFGPFATVALALADMCRADSDADSTGVLVEVEDEIGIAGWIDPDTGEPAEQTPPRIEEH